MDLIPQNGKNKPRVQKEGFKTYSSYNCNESIFLKFAKGVKSLWCTMMLGGSSNPNGALSETTATRFPDLTAFP